MKRLRLVKTPPTPPSARGGDRGFVLEVVLLGCMIVFILAVSMMDIGASRVRSAGTAYRQAQAFWAAEAGVERVAADLAAGRDSAWTGEEQGIANAFYRVRIESRDENGAVVVSTGEFRRPNGERIPVTVEAELRKQEEGGGYGAVSWRRVKP